MWNRSNPHPHPHSRYEYQWQYNMFTIPFLMSSNASDVAGAPAYQKCQQNVTGGTSYLLVLYSYVLTLLCICSKLQ